METFFKWGQAQVARRLLHSLRGATMKKCFRGTRLPWVYLYGPACSQYVSELQRNMRTLLVMTSQVAACNRLHPMNERLCRWLKLVHNRLRRDEFPIRQEFMAMMLGVHRPTVSTAAKMLQQAGLIRYSRGQMQILDADGLRNGSCECLELIEKQFEKMFDQPFRRDI